MPIAGRGTIGPVRRWTYDTMYRLGVAPYDSRRPCQQLVELIDSGRVAPCRALEIACGTGTNAMFLAERGFEVTAFDYSTQGIAVARARAAERGLEVDWRVDDATTMDRIEGEFGLIVDCGSLSDIGRARRKKAWAQMERRLAPGGRFFHWGFEHEPRWYAPWTLPFAGMSLRFDEIREQFGADWEIEELAVVRSAPFVGFGCYLLGRRAD